MTDQDTLERVVIDDAEELAYLLEEGDLGLCPSCGEELVFESRGSRTLVVTPTCHHRLPVSLASKVREQVGATSVHIHPRRLFDVARPASDLVPGALSALVSFNGHDPVLFRHGNALVTVKGGQLAELKPVQLQVLLAQAARWQSGERSGDFPVARFVDPPASVVRMILALDAYDQLPEVDRVVISPVLAPDGSLVATPGYHPGSQLFYAPAADMVDLAIPEPVSREDVDAALELLLGELLGDFPFVGPADRANALGGMLVPFLRDCIDGPTPMHLYDAPDAGTGKGLLAAVSAIPSCGDAIASRQWSRSEEERRKSILGLLRDGAAVALFDNVEGKINSPHLNSALTQRVYADRVLRTHDAPGMPVRCWWQMTANNGQPSGDFKRRVVMIRLDAKCEFPRGRTGPQPGREWRHVPLEGWARERRAELAAACLVLCRWWVQAGMPLAPLSGFGSYEQYQQVVGGVLASAGVDGFLSNLDQLDETDERDQLAALFAAWLDGYGSEPKLAVEVVRDGRLAEQLAELGLRPDDVGAVGTWLGLHRDRVADNKRLERARRGNRNAWRVAPFAPSSHPE